MNTAPNDWECGRICLKTKHIKNTMSHGNKESVDIQRITDPVECFSSLKVLCFITLWSGIFTFFTLKSKRPLLPLRDYSSHLNYSGVFIYFLSQFFFINFIITVHVSIVIV